jgi:2-dehydropantoate 2-reductase
VPVKALHLTDMNAAENFREPFDFAFISMKSYDTEWAAHFIKRFVKPEGFFISLQNCWNDPVIGSIVGNDREMGCIASHIEVALWEPGHVNRGGEPGRNHGHVVFRVGEQSGQITPRSEKIAGMLDCIDAAYATDNLWGERWAKLCQNGMGNAISAMSGLGSQQMAEDPRCRLIRIHLAKEGAQVGLAMGLKVVDMNGKPATLWADADKGDVFEELDDFMSQRGGRVNWLASMAQDIKKGRHSETDFMNGLICQKGREVKVPTPFHNAIVELMQGIDDGSIKQGPETVDMILKKAGR